MIPIPSVDPIPPEPSVGFEHLDDEQLRQLSLSASITLVVGRLLLGRCMVEILHRDLLAEWGYSGINHYAHYYLQVDAREAKECRRVVRKLAILPRITAAAEAGRLRWSYLVEILRIATPETEEEWLAAALSSRSHRRLRRLVDRAMRDVPEDPYEPPVSEKTVFEMEMIPEESELQQAAIATLSQQVGRPLTGREAHMELYRLAVEGQLRTSEGSLEKTETLIEELIRIRREQDEKDLADLREELRRQGGPASDPPMGSEEGGPASDPPAGCEEPGPAPAPAEQLPAAEPYYPPFMKQPQDQTVPEGLPRTPWAAALVEEMACPGNPDLLVASSTKPGAEIQDFGCPCKDCVSRRSRHIPRWVRRKVLRRDGFRCACPDCPNMVWIDLHHIVFWCDGGLSVPNNLIVLCRRCHRNLHRGFLLILGNPEAGLRFLDQRGRHLGSTTAEEQRVAVEFARYSTQALHARTWVHPAG